MKKIKFLIILVFFTFISGCGYAPLVNKQKVDFNISELNFEGDTKINFYISENLDIYKNTTAKDNSYDVSIFSQYEKQIVNKDKKGNPKNYNIQVKVDLNIKKGSQKISKIIIREKSLQALSKKVNEIELEKKYIKHLTDLISNDIIFFITNQ